MDFVLHFSGFSVSEDANNDLHANDDDTSKNDLESVKNATLDAIENLSPRQVLNCDSKPMKYINLNVALLVVLLIVHNTVRVKSLQLLSKLFYSKLEEIWFLVKLCTSLWFNGMIILAILKCQKKDSAQNEFN